MPPIKCLEHVSLRQVIFHKETKILEIQPNLNATFKKTKQNNAPTLPHKRLGDTVVCNRTCASTHTFHHLRVIFYRNTLFLLGKHLSPIVAEGSGVRQQCSQTDDKLFSLPSRAICRKVPTLSRLPTRSSHLSTRAYKPQIGFCSFSLTASRSPFHLSCIVFTPLP